MNLPYSILPSSHRRVFRLVGCFFALASSCFGASEAGSITGTVSNRATGDLLAGATLLAVPSGRTVLTDDTGRYVIHDLAAGTYEIVASYAGLDPVTDRVAIQPGVVTRRNFDLSNRVYLLDAYKVAGEREGGAAAITAQRNADNVKQVVAMDSYGNLPNMSVGEMAALLPGVSGAIGHDGVIIGIQIRGMAPGLNRVTVDGGLPAGGGLGRAFTPERYPGAKFDQLELTKGHTPDNGVDGLGGTINLKSRSPLSMREKRRVNYMFSTRYAAPFTEQIKWREQHRAHPVLNVAYQEIFDVAGGERNLGLAVNAFYSENVNGTFGTVRDFENTTATPAYLWSYQTYERYNSRKLANLSTIVDYRLSPTAKLRLKAGYADANEPFVRHYDITAATTQAVGTIGTAGIIPGYTDRITQVRAAAGSTITLNAQGLSVFNRNAEFSLGAEHDFPRLKLDYTAGYNRVENNTANGKSGATLATRISGVGWTLDRTSSDLYPRFVQTAGPDITNPANYRPVANGLTTLDNDIDEAVKELRGNARYQPLEALPVFVKAGFRWRGVKVDSFNRNRRYNYLGTTALPTDPNLVFWDTTRLGRNIPQWEPSMFYRERKLVSPELWREDDYFREQTKFTGLRGVTETITAGYLMSDGQLGRGGFLGGTHYIVGLRTEKTETGGWGWTRARIVSTAAQQLADPVAAATRDYAGNWRQTSGSYTKSFPSVHLAQNLGANFKGRVSWSTSMGRPNLTNSQPNETVSEINQTLTLNNPSLLPQLASNWDATLDYYFEPAGNISVGWFHKTIKDFIVNGSQVGTVPFDTNNGFGGEYGGFTVLTNTNGGTAYVQGWEFSYQQQFTFLPDLFKGLGVVANFTILDTHGDFGGTARLRAGEVAGFIPRTGNLIFSWRHRRLSARWRINYTGDFITAYTAGSPARNLYVEGRTMVSPGVAYDIRPYLTLTCDITNLFNAHQVQYRGIPAQMAVNRNNGTPITVGVNGRF